jgi:hypothetical protein
LAALLSVVYDVPVIASRHTGESEGVREQEGERRERGGREEGNEEGTTCLLTTSCDAHAVAMQQQGRSGEGRREERTTDTRYANDKRHAPE